MSNEVTTLAVNIVNFLKQQLDGDVLNPNSHESVEVAVQCIEAAFELEGAECVRTVNLLRLVRTHDGSQDVTAEAPNSVAPPRVLSEADRFKHDGNKLMRAERYREALEMYTRALAIDPLKPVYFSNRAAARIKLGEHEAAVADCMAALRLQPDYSKAHGRLGLAYTALGRHREARAAYARAAELEPENGYYQMNVQLADERLRSRRERSAMDIGGLLQNPALVNMATEMLSDPNMQNLISVLMNTTTAGDAGARPDGN